MSGSGMSASVGDGYLPQGFTYVCEPDGNPVGLRPRPTVTGEQVDLLFRIVRIWQERQTLAEQLFAEALSRAFYDGKDVGRTETIDDLSEHLREIR